jgi:hypothetical protein
MARQQRAVVPSAEKAFDAKLETLLTPAVTRRHPESENTPTEVLTIPSTPLDQDGVERAFFQYGTYLELIGGDVTVETTQAWQFPHEEERAHV